MNPPQVQRGDSDDLFRIGTPISRERNSAREIHPRNLIALLIQRRVTKIAMSHGHKVFAIGHAIRFVGLRHMSHRRKGLKRLLDVVGELRLGPLQVDRRERTLVDDDRGQVLVRETDLEITIKIRRTNKVDEFLELACMSSDRCRVRRLGIAVPLARKNSPRACNPPRLCCRSAGVLFSVSQTIPPLVTRSATGKIK